MSHISLHIDADSAGDLLETIQQLGQTFLERTAAGEQLVVEQDVAPKAARTRATKEEMAARSALPKSETDSPATSTDTTAGGSSNTATAVETPASEQVIDQPAADGALDYDKDVAPKVLAAVQKRGKPFVIATMDTLKAGCMKASDLPAEKWQTLLDALAAE